MANDVLNSLLKEYEQKKVRAELDLERRKSILYDLIPRLKEIDEELNHYVFATTKNILNLTDKNKSQVFVSNLQNEIQKLKKEKEQILINNNYSVDYLKPFYECKLCNDTGYVTDENNHTVMCSCLKQKLLDISFNEANMYNIKKENFNFFNENLYSDKKDASRYRFDISPRENILNIKNKCIDFVKHFDDIQYNNLLFTGSTGLR